MSRANEKQKRHDRLSLVLDQNPLHTDEELASILGVSLSTVRLDRALLGIPELRERTIEMARKATSKLRSLKREEFIGELLDLEPDAWGLSVLETSRDMAFRHTDQIWDHYIYAQASALAIAVVEADMVVVGSVRARYRSPALVGDRLIARAKVGVHKGNKYIISVRTRVGEKEIFVGRYIVVSMPQVNSEVVSGETGN